MKGFTLVRSELDPSLAFMFLNVYLSTYKLLLMAKGTSSTKKAATKKSGQSPTKSAAKKATAKAPRKYGDFYDPNKPNRGRKIGRYADTWNVEKPAPANGRTGMYLDTWLPEGKLPKDVGIYADTWISPVKFTKGIKKGIYADTWIPAYAALKIQSKK